MRSPTLRPALATLRFGIFSRFAATAARAAVLGTPLSLLLVAAPAHAQADSDRATARALGQEGEAALQNKDYATAEDRFRRADKLIHAPTLELGLARALVGVGKLVEAQEAYNRIVREGVAPGAPAVFTRALQDAKKEVEGVSPRLGTVTIVVKAAGGADLPSENVTLDGAPVNTASLGVRRPIDPGSHVLQATATGYKPAELRFSVTEGAASEAPLTLEPEPASPSVAAVGPVGNAGTTGTGAEPHRGLPGYLPWVAFGVGGAGLILGGVTGVLAMGAHSTLAGECPANVCPPGKQNDLDSYHTLGLLSTVGFIVAGVGAATGVVLVLAQPKHEASAGARLEISPFVGPGTLGAVGAF